MSNTFPDPVTSFRLPPDMLKAAKTDALRRDIKLADLIRRALQKELGIIPD